MPLVWSSSPADLPRELEWCLGIVLAEVENVARFQRLRYAVQEEYIFGDAANALAQVASIEEQCGGSFAACGLRIALTQAVEGLESQKRLATRYRENCSNGFTNYTTYLLSLRSEGTLDAPRFTSLVANSIGNAELETRHALFLTYHILGQVPLEEGLPHLLTALTTSSAIDLYEAMLDAGSESIVRSWSSSKHFVACFERLAGVIDDQRLRKCLWLANGESELQPRAADRTKKVERLLEGSDEHWPASTQLVSDQLETARQIGDAGDQALQALRRTALALVNLPLGQWLQHSIFRLSHPVAAQRGLSNILAWVHGDEPLLDEARALSLCVGGDVEDDEWGQLVRAFIAADYDTCIALSWRRAADPHSSKAALRFIYWVCVVSLIAKGDVDSAVDRIAGLAAQNPQALSATPCEALARLIYDSKHPVASHLDYALLLDACIRLYSTPWESQRSYAYEDHLRSYNVDRPSDLPRPAEPLGPRDVQFLRSICVPEVMQLSVAFGTTRELEEERINICGTLVQIDPARTDEYQAELREIVRRRHINSAVHQLQLGKISVDEDALKADAARTLRNDYERLQALLTSGMQVSAADIHEELITALRGNTVRLTLLRIPDNEASTLLQQIVRQLLTEFFLNPEHGLDCYLSMRIRHGTLSGQLRGPLERENLITQVDAPTGAYKPNEYWANVLHSLQEDDTLWPRIDELLREFSASWDDLIAHLNRDLIQVRREEKPAGLFRAALPPTMVLAIAADVTPTMSFEVFVDECHEVFWAVVGQDLKAIQGDIDHRHRPQALALLSDVERKIQDLAADRPVPELSDALRRSRTELGQAFDRLRDWFALPQKTSGFIAPLDEFIDIGVETVRTLHREFNPRIEKYIDPGIPRLANALVVLSDIFFVLFDNIYKHSGCGPNPFVSVAVAKRDDQVHFRVANELAEETDRSALEATLVALTEGLNDGGLSNATTREGGTGLHKLHRLVGRPKVGEHFTFGLSGDMFFVTFALRVSEIAGVDAETVA